MMKRLCALFNVMMMIIIDVGFGFGSSRERFELAKSGF